jgi:hypothetical protein
MGAEQRRLVLDEEKKSKKSEGGIGGLFARAGRVFAAWRHEAG